MNPYLDKDHSLIPTGWILRNDRHLSQDEVSILNFNISKVPKAHKLTHCSSHPTEVLRFSAWLREEDELKATGLISGDIFFSALTALICFVEIIHSLRSLT